MLYIKNKLFVFALLFLFLLSACNQETSSSAGEGYNPDKDTNTQFNQLALITNLTDNVISPAYQTFLTQAERQTQLVQDYCQAEKNILDQTGEQQAVLTAIDAAQVQWRNTMAAWQQAELMLLGPLLEQDGLLRNNIYSWPIQNSCAVDYDVLYFQTGEVNGKPYDITQRTPSRKGLGALDYLLFNQDLNHSCDASFAPAGWSNQTEQNKRVARCNFATEVASDIQNNAEMLVQQWLALDGYANKLKQAGTTGNEFNTEHDAVNRISDALFYLDSSTKDGKLATPLGIFANECGSTACPQTVESKYSQNSLANILNNLIGFEKLLTGNGGLGFTDYLLDVGDDSTATEMANNVTNTINAINQVDSSLANELTNNPEQIEQIHNNVKNITDQLKTDFITSLALELPATSAGDND